MNPFKAFLATFFTKLNNNHSIEKSSIYDISIFSLSGKAIDLSNFKGKYILFVNVASKCGFTPQYKDLEVLSQLPIPKAEKLMIKKIKNSFKRFINF